MTHRRLRPWVWQLIGAAEGICIGIIIIICFCYAFEAFTGFNPLWFAGVIK